MGFKSKLQEELESELNEKELDLLPSGFQTVGKVIIIKLKSELLEKRKLIADTYLKLLPYIRSVYINRGKIEGEYRTPEQIEYLAGEKDPIVLHKEHGVKYKFDITKIMFSQGNLKERKHLASLVKNQEVIVDMFAGIGYFSLPMAVLSNPSRIFSIEFNPIAFRFLVENVKLNNVDKKVIPLHGDCKVEAPRLASQGIEADRIVMGVFPAPKGYIEEALKLTKKSGTIIHYEGIVDGEHELKLYNEFKNIAENSDIKTNLLDSRFIKSYGPNLYHCVNDIEISKN